MDEAWMREALTLAREALLAGETPVGCVIVRGGEIVARARNRREELGDPTAHAEVLAIREAARRVGNWRLTDCCIYVTLEPCPMCMGAALNARIRKIYFGAYEQKGRSMTAELAESNLLNHRTEVEGGVLEEECSRLLSGFFRGLRARAKEKEGEKEEEDANF